MTVPEKGKQVSPIKVSASPVPTTGIPPIAERLVVPAGAQPLVPGSAPTPGGGHFTGFGKGLNQGAGESREAFEQRLRAQGIDPRTRKPFSQPPHTDAPGSSTPPSK